MKEIAEAKMTEHTKLLGCYVSRRYVVSYSWYNYQYYQYFGFDIHKALFQFSWLKIVVLIALEQGFVL